MSIYCPHCKQPTLNIVSGLDLGPDGKNDENDLHTLRCDHCEFVGVGFYEESREWDRVRWQHVGWRTTAAAFADVESLIHACPDPADDQCVCEAHRRFGFRDDAGAVQPLCRVTTLGTAFLLKNQAD